MNRIVEVEKHHEGWRIRFETPDERYQTQLFCGYTRDEAIKLAKNWHPGGFFLFEVRDNGK